MYTYQESNRNAMRHDGNAMKTHSRDPEKLNSAHIPEIKYKRNETRKIVIQRNCIAGLDSVGVPDMSKITMQKRKVEIRRN